MKQYSVCFGLIHDDFDGDYEKGIESRKIYAQTIIDAVLIVQKELVDERNNPGDYIYTSRCENELYVCIGVPQ